MIKIVERVTANHKSTSRDYLARMMDNKIDAMRTASKFDHEYWDGDRRFGYGGYRFIEGWWTSVAKSLIDSFDLTQNSKVLDLGCGKGFLMKELTDLLPGLQVAGIELSSYAIEKSHPDVRGSITQGDITQAIPFQDGSFDLVVCINVLHNFGLRDVQFAISEIARISNRAFCVVESYRDEAELFNLQCWALTCKSFYTPSDWEFIFDSCEYFGELEFIFFEG